MTKEHVVELDKVIEILAENLEKLLDIDFDKPMSAPLAIGYSVAGLEIVLSKLKAVRLEAEA